MGKGNGVGGKGKQVERARGSIEGGREAHESRDKGPCAKSARAERGDLGAGARVDTAGVGGGEVALDAVGHGDDCNLRAQ